VARCAELARLGIEHAVMIKSGAWTPEAISVLAAALPELHDLGPASGTRSYRTGRDPRQCRPPTGYRSQRGGESVPMNVAGSNDARHHDVVVPHGDIGPWSPVSE